MTDTTAGPVKFGIFDFTKGSQLATEKREPGYYFSFPGAGGAYRLLDGPYASRFAAVNAAQTFIVETLFEE